MFAITETTGAATQQTHLDVDAKSTEQLIIEQAQIAKRDAQILAGIADQLSDLMMTVPHIGLEASRLSDERGRVYDDVVNDLIQLITGKVLQFREEASRKESFATLLETTVKREG